jgi:uncharacterized SAM-binding protein YcdF (DUF218 family)
MGTKQLATLEDMDKLLELLKEYTEKLRKVCEDRIEFREQYGVLRIGLGVMICFNVLFAFASLFSASFGDEQTSRTARATIFFASSVGFLVLFGIVYLFGKSWQRALYRSRYDVHYLTDTLTRLIATASQYREHASNRIGDKFAFDLRLAEAEAVLRMSKDLFGNSLAQNEVRLEISRPVLNGVKADVNGSAAHLPSER